MKLLEKNELGNGMILTMEDASRLVAGDRFNVKVKCRLTIPVKAEWFACLAESQELTAKIQKRIGDVLEFQITKDKHFIDQSKREEVVSDLVAQINNHVRSYLSADLFPEKLFASRYAEEKAKLLIPEADSVPELNNEDDGPSDFSSCFVDK